LEAWPGVLGRRLAGRVELTLSVLLGILLGRLRHARLCVSTRIARAPHIMSYPAIRPSIDLLDRQGVAPEATTNASKFSVRTPRTVEVFRRVRRLVG
jgi:hypothetical protein